MTEGASALISKRIAELGDWRGETLGKIRALIKEADPDVVEEWKWRGTPVWSHDGILCTGETYKAVVKMTFAKGASLKDPTKLFNSSLEGNTRRAIDIRESEKINAPALKALIRAAVALNGLGKKKTAMKAKPRSTARTSKARTSRPKAKGAKKKPRKPRKRVRLLSGGNPQIAKGDGDAPVQAYLRAMPGWKRALGKRVDALVVRTVPGVKKAVKWNSPMYGLEGQGFFLGLHVFTRYLKLTFFRGALLKPLPPGASKHPDVRYLDLHEGELDEKQLASWVKQAAALPGWLVGK